MGVLAGWEVGREGGELMLMARGIRVADPLDAFVVAKTAFCDGSRQGSGCVFPVGFGGQHRTPGWGRAGRLIHAGPEINGPALQQRPGEAGRQSEDQQGWH